ncbi:hypothetical protein AQUCO_00200714v1 [Aquilegia coerulea]|uniref:Uncharacterized protein n=1 Tax=Aquilegia coerulea TaxID=218851 RepID=A0A2G5F4J1_AQUCA|nr:hypothetical protein AQUCO_00200714v1 [Aquilegia coerulea]
MEEYTLIPMERSGKIMRRSMHIFLKSYNYFTSTAVLLVLPVAVSVLLSQALIPSMTPFIVTIHARLESLFRAAGFPSSLQFFSILSIKISQTICSSIFTLPFTLSFLLVAKAAIIRFLCNEKSPISPPFSSLFPLCNPLLNTYLCNTFIILSANASAFFLFFLAFNSLDAFGFSCNNYILFLSAAGAVLYSVILANTFITCNLALIVAGMENCGGYLAILKACVLIKGRAATALSLALPVNFGLAAVEALFQYRVVRAYHLSEKLTFSIGFEGLLLAYLYSLLIIIDTITTCIFYKSCKSSTRIDEGRYYRIELAEEQDIGTFTNSKISYELP